MTEVNKVLGLGEIKAILPYRYPVLMLDRVQNLGGGAYVAVKNVSMNELFFQGHFPNHPIMPGVLQVEAMKQLCEIAFRNGFEVGTNEDVFIRLVEKVKFRKPVNPGDRIKTEITTESKGDREMVFNASNTTNSGVTCEAKITLAIRAKAAPAEMPELFTEYDKSDDITMNVNQIMKMVPHRYPFLLIDNVIKIEGDILTAVKNVTGNEQLFCGCPDDYAVLPEALQYEIIAQAGCASVLSRPENAGKIGYFMSIDRAETLGPIYPGDQLICEITLPPSKGRFARGTGHIRVGNRRVMTASLMFAIVEE